PTRRGSRPFSRNGSNAALQASSQPSVARSGTGPLSRNAERLREGAGECGVDRRGREVESRVQEASGKHALSFEKDGLPHLPVQRANRKSRSRDDRRTANGPAERLGELLVRHRIRRTEIHRPREAALEHEREPGEEIGEPPPAQPLLARADAARDAESERGQHASESAALAGENDALS